MVYKEVGVVQYKLGLPSFPRRKQFGRFPVPIFHYRPGIHVAAAGIGNNAKTAEQEGRTRSSC